MAQFSAKRVQIDKANFTILIVMSVACFLTIFSLIASRALLQQRSYQAGVIEKKEIAREQLKQNIVARDQLVDQYKIFVGNQQNLIGGNSAGTGEKDGDNAKLVLDALPSKYDFPAVATSIEKLLAESVMAVRSISGTDDEITQTTAAGDSSVSVEIPFEVTAEGSIDQFQAFVSLLERSIRPVEVRKITLSAQNDKLSTSVSAVTYFQPEKTLSIKIQDAK